MVTRREVLQATAAGAVVGGVLPKVYAATGGPATVDPDCRRGLRHIGPLLPTPPQALKRWMGA